MKIAPNPGRFAIRFGLKSVVRGFTLLETVLVVGFVSILGSLGMMSVQTVVETAREHKLRCDVEVLNSAMPMFLANGGDLSEAISADDVLDALKTRADGEGQAKLMGLKGSFIDRRISPVFQTPKESASDQARALWNGTKQRFVVVTSGEAGIREFTIDNSAAATAGAKARHRFLSAANVHSGSAVWIWDYSEGQPDLTMSVGGSTGSGGSNGGLVVSHLQKLNGIIHGSVQLISAQSFSFSGATEVYGDLYVPGTPTITGSLASHVVEGTGSTTPTNYTLNIDSGHFGAGENGSGTIYTRIDPPAHLSSVDDAYLDAISSGSTSGLPVIPVDLTRNPTNGILAGGNYGSVKVSGSGQLVLGAPGQTTVYNMSDLTMTGGATIMICGPVVINLQNGGSIQGILGTSAHPDWLSIYSQGDLKITGGGNLSVVKVVSNKAISIQGDIHLTQGIIAAEVSIAGGSSVVTGTF